MPLSMDTSDRCFQTTWVPESPIVAKTSWGATRSKAFMSGDTCIAVWNRGREMVLKVARFARCRLSLRW